MTVALQSVGKRFRDQWVFRGLSRSFDPGITAVTGPNGSGKSTLFRALSGWLSLSEGQIVWEENGRSIPRETIFREVSFSGPYMTFPPLSSVHEVVSLHLTCRPGSITNPSHILDRAGIGHKSGAWCRDLSTGQLQRLRLALALHTDARLYLLDEPCANLDDEGVSRFYSMLADLPPSATVLLASNDPRERETAAESWALPAPTR